MTKQLNAMAAEAGLVVLGDGASFKMGFDISKFDADGISALLDSRG